MKSRNILFFNHTSTVCGAERVLLGLLKGLRHEPCRILLVCPEGDLARESANLEVPHRSIPELRARFTRNPFNLLRYLASCASVVVRLRTLLRQQDPDIVHANSVRAGVIASLASVGLRPVIVWHVHDILPDHPITTVIRLLARGSRRTSVIAVSRAAATSFQGNRAQRSAAAVPVQVIHNGVDTNLFRSDPAARASVRKELGIGDDVYVVGIVGQITPRKGQLELVRAFASAANAIPGAILLIVGAPMFHEEDRQYYSEVESLRIQLGVENQVRLLGKRSDVPALLNGFDVVVLNSYQEPFSLVVLEALACGKPIIATAVDGVIEVIENRSTGILIQPGDTIQLAAELCSLASSPDARLRIGENGRHLVASHFSLERHTQKIMAYYDRAAQSGPHLKTQVAIEQ